jgi:hypothetical protein
MPSDTTCRPYGAETADSADKEVVEGSAGACFSVRTHRQERSPGRIPSDWRIARGREGAVAFLTLCYDGTDMCMVNKTSSIIAQEVCFGGCREAEKRGGCGMLFVEGT